MEDVKLVKALDYDFMVIRVYRYRDFTIQVTDLKKKDLIVEAYDRWKEIQMCTCCYPDGNIRISVDFLASQPERINSFTERYKQAMELYQFLNEHKDFFLE